MAAITNLLLSGSTDGKHIKVAATATPGTLIHTADSVAQDELWLYAVNSTAASVRLTIEAGGVADPDNLIEVDIPPTGSMETLVVAGMRLTNSAVVRAFAGTGNVVTLRGHVNRIS